MAVFPLENGVFSGTLLRFNVRGYVYIWSLIFSMFKFFVCIIHVHCICYSLHMLLIVGALRFMRARRVCLWVCMCVLVRIHYTFIWGEWGNGI